MTGSRWPRPCNCPCPCPCPCPCRCPCLLPLLLLLALLLLVPVQAHTSRSTAPSRSRPTSTRDPPPLMTCSTPGSPPGVDVAAWLEAYNQELLRVRQAQATKAWEALTGRPHAPSSPHHVLSAAHMAEWLEERAWEASRFFKCNVTEPQRRMLHLITRGPRYTLPEARSLASLVRVMRRRYTNTTVALRHVILHGESDLTSLMTASRDPGLLAAAWRKWHDALGSDAIPLFTRAVEVMNSAARRGGYRDMGAAWRAELELGAEDVRAAVGRLYAQVAPLYRLLHAVVRDALRRYYGREQVPRDQPIPIHLSGDLWGQDWSSLLDLLLPASVPVPPRPAPPATSLPANLLAVDIVKAAQKVFKGLGFPPLPTSVLTHAWLGGSGGRGRGGACHPSALDMFTPEDYRVVVCAGRRGGGSGWGRAVREAVHELGHVHYFHAYRHLPPLLRDAPNSALHETIGDTVQLVAPVHDPDLDLDSDFDPDLAHDPPRHPPGPVSPADPHVTGGALRRLLQEALNKLPRLAFAAALETWRWDVFQGTVSPSEYNPSFWRLRTHYQGMSPPSPRPAHAFDAAAKYHVAQNIPYARYLVAVVAQFQVHRGLCEAALGRPLPLPPHACPPAAFRRAAATLRRVMSAGASVTWREALGALTGGSRDLDATPLLEYFAPLTRWLQCRVQAANLTLGW